jgi:hypothetical protein
MIRAIGYQCGGLSHIAIAPIVAITNPITPPMIEWNIGLFGESFAVRYEPIVPNTLR